MAQTGKTVSGFRGRLFVVIVGLVAVVTLAGAVLVHRHLAQVSAEETDRVIRQKVAAALHTRETRQAVLADICTELAAQPRILAALEDDALDLLYPSAINELRQIMEDRRSSGDKELDRPVQAIFYRFLDRQGRLIAPADPVLHGQIPASGEAIIRLPEIPEDQQAGYFISSGPDGRAVEMITVPIISTQTFRPIAALAVGFPLNLRAGLPLEENLAMGLSTAERLLLPGFEVHVRESLEDKVLAMMADGQGGTAIVHNVDDVPYHLLIQLLNPDSAYPRAYGVFVSSLQPLKAQQARIRMQILVAAALITAIGLVTAHVMATRLARPVEALAVATEEEHKQRIDAEIALDTTSQELERAARFSADASHQLKTPVAVVRAGLEELLIDPGLPEQLRKEVNSLIRHTGRLTHVIEDLLLLSRLDAGRLDLSLRPVDLRLILDAQLDDLSVLPQESGIRIEQSNNGPAWVQGNPTYTSLIIQNLLENAWKYNRPSGRIVISVEQTGGATRCRVGNTGKGIPFERQSLIFERFHRGPSGENVAGYGLGLNLAAKLADLHGGQLKLVLSEEDWTEFDLILQSAPEPDLETEDPA